VLKRRVPRVLVSGFLLAVAVSGLTACRTSPTVAAYVGDTHVSVAELEDAVSERLSDDAIAEWAAGREEEFTRRVLALLVQEEVHAAAAERYDVRVGNDDVRRRIGALLGSDDPDAVYERLAVEQGVGREDVFENVRQQMIRQEIAESEGRAEAPGEGELRARYDEVREDLAQTSFGYITVPDQATADAVLAQLTANPAAYPTLAAQYAGAYTLPALEERAPDDIPPPLAEGVAEAAPNTGFTVPIPEAGGVVVAFVAGTVYPEFDEVRPQLEEEAAGQADAAGAELVNAVREDLAITINPRYGVLEEGRLVPADGGVVDILGDEPPAEGGPGLAPPGN
jgi:peptidyl-prolyl cis-trans isomerase SurA